MRIACPFCGPRDSEEFVTIGSTAIVRPDPAAADAARAFHDFVYLRDNPAGAHDEHWYHATGCRRWLVVTRDTISHEIMAVRLAAS